MSADPIMISALAHYSYCPRRCALIYVENLFDENLFTLRGTRLHERADQATTRSERGIRVERALPLWSERIGLVGRADVVEWQGDQPYPVEYKSGKPKNTRHGAYQLCAQALCLEEMTGRDIPEGALFFFETRERIPISLTPDFRAEVLEAIELVRQILDEASSLPPPVADNRCRNCSLLDACMPFAVERALAKPSDLYRPRPEVILP
jgi:CRISPR-associated exonuclease Cas4